MFTYVSLLFGRLHGVFSGIFLLGAIESVRSLIVVALRLIAVGGPTLVTAGQIWKSLEFTVAPFAS